MTRNCLFIQLLLGIFIFGSVYADTFTNKKTGEEFVGFRTTKFSGNKTLVYSDAEKKFLSLDMSEYNVTMDDKGRRNSVVMVSITDSEAMLSDTVSKTISDAIVKAANTGPRFILIKIDNPGGRGEYMKNICTTISNIDNCIRVAYISGGRYGGAYSAAAMIALSCDKIFISPTATISAVAPYAASSSSLTHENFIKTYSPDSLSSFGIFAATLAEKHNRPALLAKALVDKKISLVEVMDADGKKMIVEKGIRQPNQTIIKTICEGFMESPDGSGETAGRQSQNTKETDVYSRILTLTPSDAIELKLTDETADSIQAVLSSMNASDAQIANAPGIDAVVKQFVAAKRNVGQNLARIEFLENRVSTLQEQFNKIEDSVRTTPATRAVTRDDNNSQRRGRFTFPGTDYYGPDYNTNQNQIGNLNDTLNQNNGDNQYYPDTQTTNRIQDKYRQTRKSETIVSNEQSTQTQQVRVELSMVLNTLIEDYRRTIAIAKRWSGVLPPDMTVQDLQNNMESAMALYNNIRYRPQ